MNYIVSRRCSISVTTTAIMVRSLMELVIVLVARIVLSGLFFFLLAILEVHDSRGEHSIELHVLYYFCVMVG